MTNKKHGTAGTKAHASSKAQSGSNHTADDKAAPDQPATDLDAARYAAAQRAAHQAEVLRKGVFPALMASALKLDDFFETAAYKLYLEQMLEEAGNPTDPIERMLLEQLVLAHLRIAQLHVGAGQAQGVEATKVYNAVVARMLGEFRRTALALRAYRVRVPEGKPASNLKLFKAAQ